VLERQHKSEDNKRTSTMRMRASVGGNTPPDSSVIKWLGLCKRIRVAGASRACNLRPVDDLCSSYQFHGHADSGASSSYATASGEGAGEHRALRGSSDG
jgi:hypothetical protein